MTSITTTNTNAKPSSIPVRKSTNAVAFTPSTKMGRSSATTTSSSTNSLSNNNTTNNEGNSWLSSAHYLHDDDVDMEYCKEISRRAVARAALHLGVEEMSGDALCVLGDVLVAYLERISKMMSSTVEASSRSSAHCNVFDALHAVEKCTPLAATQLYLHKPAVDEDSDTNRIMGTNNDRNRGSSSIHNGGGGLGSPWEGLASFLFGDDWCNHQELHPKPRLANGKVAAISNANGSANPNGSISANGNTNSGGWNAPHYDDIEPFPQRIFRKGNRKRIFFHDLGKEEEACRSSGMPTTGMINGVVDGDATKPGIVGEGTESKQPFTGKNDVKDIVNGHASKSLSASTKSIVKGAERNAEVQANEVPERNYRNGNSSFWGSLATVPSSQLGTNNGIEGSGNSGAMEIDVSVGGSGNDSGSSGGVKEDTGSVAGAKRKNDGTATTAGGGASHQQDKRLKTTRNSDEGGTNGQFDNNASGSDAMLRKISKRGSRPIYVPLFLPPFPPEHTYNPSSSIVLSAPSDSQSLPANMSGVAELSTAATASTASKTGGNPMYDERETKSVRESLITLGRSVGTAFWGTKNGDCSLRGVVPSIRVQTSIPGVINQGRAQNNKLVTPLERASTLKVSRILEGS